MPALDLLIAEVLSDEQNGMSAAEAILKVMRQKAIKGDLKAAEMLLNRAYGKPKESIEVKVTEVEISFDDSNTTGEE